MSIFVFDIETIPDTTGGRVLYDLGDLDDGQTANALFALRREKVGHDFLALPLHRIVAISAVFAHQNQLKVWSLGDPDSPEKELIERFFTGIEKYTPTLVTWNGSGFDLPVLHYRALIHGVQAPRYWELGDEDREFRWNNYLNRFHTRHIDLMDLLAGYQPRAHAPLDNIASLCGFPGKMGMDGSKVWQAFIGGDIIGIRNYCETDVLNTYLVYLRFEHMRGKLTPAEYEQKCNNLRTYLTEANQPHFQTFMDEWS